MIPDKMYETHRAQNYTMAERTKYRKKMFMEQANRQREIASRNCYAIGKEQNVGRGNGEDTNKKADRV